jgi:apolipoprotein N-acyltransferase
MSKLIGFYQRHTKAIRAIVLSGVLSGLAYPCYPAYPFGVLAWVALVPILLQLRKAVTFRQHFVLIFPVFIISSPIGFWWTSYYNLGTFFICYITQMFSLYGVFIIHFFVQKRFGWYKSLVILPFLWTTVDWATHYLPHNLQVHYIAYTQANMPYFIQYADLGGMWSVGFWVIGLNVLITFLVQYRATKYYILTGLWVLLAFGYSVWVIAINSASAIGNGNTTSKVSLIQTNIDSYASDDSATVNETLTQILTLSASAVRYQKPDLLILPEAAFPFSLFKDSSFLAFSRYHIADWNTNVAIGYVDFEEKSKNFRNLALVFTPQLAVYWDSLRLKESDVKVYQKEYGLPFMEFMPYCATCPSMRDRQLIRGSEPYSFKFSKNNGEIQNVALTICWEQTYPDKMASLVNNGADFVALMNNDAWFGKTPGAKFLLSFTRLRAIENRRTIARCSNGGISCFVDPFGRIYGQIPWFTENQTTAEVMGVSKKSFYTRKPHFFVISAGLILLLLISCFEIQRRRNALSEI